MADLVRQLFGGAPGFMVSTVAVGHSRRPDSFAVRMAEAAAAELQLPFAKIFDDRFVDGVSHPKEFAKLPALERLVSPTSPVLLVDDVATSGWHLEEAVTDLRKSGIACIAIAWISGTVIGEGAALPLRPDFGFAPAEQTNRQRARLAWALAMARV